MQYLVPLHTIIDSMIGMWLPLHSSGWSWWRAHVLSRDEARTSCPSGAGTSCPNGSSILGIHSPREWSQQANRSSEEKRGLLHFWPGKSSGGDLKLLTPQSAELTCAGGGALWLPPPPPHYTKVHINPTKFNTYLMVCTIPMVEWAALLEAAKNLDLLKVSKGLIQGYEHYEKLPREMHHMLLELDVLEDTLQCAESGHQSHISHGDPNMLLSDEEMKADHARHQFFALWPRVSLLM